jgi:hypothetical protein
MDTETLFAPVLVLVCGTILLNLLVNSLKLNNKQRVGLRNLLVGSLVAVVVLGSVNFYIANVEYKKKHKKDLSFIDFINQGNMDGNFLKRTMVGFGTGIVFGAIDNFGLWFGMDALDPILPSGSLTKAGFGNVFSDSLSAFLSTFAGNIISKLTGVDSNTPIWADAVGTFTGCLVGLYACRFITGRT